MKTAKLGYLLAGALACCNLAHASDGAERGQAIAMQGDGSGAPCIACHGLDGAGNDAAGFPRLTGLDAGYLVKQMQDYRSGARQNAVMAPNVDNLDDQQMADVAAWYASQQPTPASLPEVDSALLELGQKLASTGDWDNYVVPCETCHGPGSLGVGSAFPRLAGQHAGYIKQQLQAWKNGTRGNDPDQLMLAIAARLSDEQIEAVAAYLARQPQQGDL